MDSRLEKRIKSIRSLPHGQFNKYRQMFDSLMKTRCREKCKEVIRNNSSIKDGNNINLNFFKSSTFNTV